MDNSEKKKNTFVFHIEWYQYINLLKLEEIESLLFIIRDYVENLKEPNKTNLSDRLLMTWLFIKNTIDKDRKNYDRRCETSKINGQKGGRPKKPNNLKKPNKAVNDNEYDSDYKCDDNEVLIDIYSFIEKNFGRTLSPIEYEVINKWDDNELTRYAIGQAVLNGAYSIKYIERILEAYKSKNIKTIQAAQEDEKKFRKRPSQGNVRYVSEPDWLNNVSPEIPLNDEDKSEIDMLLKKYQ